MWAELIIVWFIMAVIFALVLGGFITTGRGPRH